MGVSFETYLRRHWDVQRDVVTTLLRRLVDGWDWSYITILTIIAIIKIRMITMMMTKMILSIEHDYLNDLDDETEFSENINPNELKRLTPILCAD